MSDPLLSFAPPMQIHTLDHEIVVVIDHTILQHAIEAIVKEGDAYIGWIEKLPVKDAYHVALVIGMLMQADRYGRFHT